MNGSPVKTEGNISDERLDILAGIAERSCFTASGTTEVAKALRELQALRLSATARERHLAVANKLWRLCVDEGWPWNDGSTQDDLAKLGLLVATDMRADDSPEECTNCDGDCSTCFRAVKRIEDVAMEKANG